MFCKFCGHPLATDVKFCPHCGGSFPTQPDLQSPQGNFSANPVQQSYSGQGYQNQQPPYVGPITPGPTGPIPPVGNGLGYAAQTAMAAPKKALHLKLLALIAVLLAAIAVMIYVFFFKTGKPEDTLKKLEDSMNHLDTSSMLECFDDQIQGLYSGSVAVGGDLLGFDLGGLLDLGSGLGGFMSAAGLTPNVTIDIRSIDYIDSDSCIANVTITTSYQGEVSSEDTALPMELIDREWLISVSGLDPDILSSIY